MESWDDDTYTPPNNSGVAGFGRGFGRGSPPGTSTAPTPGFGRGVLRPGFTTEPQVNGFSNSDMVSNGISELNISKPGGFGGKPGGFGGKPGGFGSQNGDSEGGSTFGAKPSGFGGKPSGFGGKPSGFGSQNGDSGSGSSKGGFGGRSGGFGNKSGGFEENDDTESKPSFGGGNKGGFGGGSRSGGFGGGNKNGGFGGIDDEESKPSFGGGKKGGFGGGNRSGGFGNGNNDDDESKPSFGGGFGGGDRPPRGGGFSSSGNSGKKGCFKCGEEGHMSRECPNAESGTSKKGCFKCGEEGHMSRECPNAESGTSKKGCFKCGEEGHMSRECPNAESGGGRGGGKGCYKCKEEGHMARDCPNAESSGQSLDKDRPPPYIPPAPSEDENEIFKTIHKGINFDKYEKIPVEVTGTNCPEKIKSFDEAGLYETFLQNVKKSHYDKPTPVQKYSIPIVMSGRDLMACAQTGSGKTAAFLLPVLTGMMNSGLTSSSFSVVQEPTALVVAPTRELAVQIYTDAKRFTHGTMLRPVVLYGGTSLGHQIRNVEQGAHIVVGTPGRLIDVINKGKISLQKIKYLILDEADRMLDMGFGPEIKKIVSELGTPPKDQRQTLMFSATFPEEIQKLAAEFLNDYLFLTVGRVGGACTDVAQYIYEVPREQKRQKLCDILSESGTDKTLVFVEQKRNADFLATYLSQSGFPTTSIHGDRLQQEREEALLDFKTGRAPILVATSVAARGLDIPLVKHVINYDLPQSIDEYVHRIGRTGRCGNVGKSTSFYSNDTDAGIAKAMLRILADAQQEVPLWLEEYAKSSQSTAGFTNYGGKFGGRDIRKDQPKTRDNHSGENSNSFGGGFSGGFGGAHVPSVGGGGDDDESWD